MLHFPRLIESYSLNLIQLSSVRSDADEKILLMLETSSLLAYAAPAVQRTKGNKLYQLRNSSTGNCIYRTVAF